MTLGPGAARFARVAIACSIAAFALSGCSWFRRAPAPPSPEPFTHALEVHATAYNSVPSQTDGNPSITAFGIRLRPGMKIVAVSRDLEKLGLRPGVRLRIDGVDGVWEVGDRMSARWSRRIDLYMGLDVRAARAWGRRRVTIRW